MSILNLFNLGSFAGTDTGESFPLPADAVLLWDRASESDAVPDGFSLYTSADGNLIQGTTTIGDIGTTGGSTQTFQIQSVGSSISGAHFGSPSFSIGSRGPGSFPNINSYTTPSGGHSHPTTTTPRSIPSTVMPMGRFMTLITNASQIEEIPLNCVVFSSSRPAFFTRKTFDTHNVGLYVGTTTFSRAKNADTFPFSITWNSSGSHTHASTPSLGGADVTGPGPFAHVLYDPADPTTPHTHPTTSRTLTVYQQFKHLLPFMASANRPVKSGMIVMFKGSSIPSGWKLCDGTNGTPDMNGYFLGYDNNENLHDIVKSNKRVDTVPAGYPLPTIRSTPTSPSYYELLADFSTPTVSWPHTHTGNVPGATVTFSTNAQHATFNAPHSHTFPSAVSLFPVNFTPNFIKLVFIQKE